MDKRALENEFEEKYQLYGKMLYKIAFLYLGNSTDSEDVLQDVFLKYLSKKHDFKTDEHEKAWFIRVTQNKCKDVLRGSNLKNCSLENATFKDEEYFDLDETKMDIFCQLLKLPSKYKAVVILHYYEDLSVSEISKMLKISQSAVKMRLKRGREILKLELEDYI